MKKRMISAVLVTCLGATLALSGCGNSATNGGSEGDGAKTSADAEAPVDSGSADSSEELTEVKIGITPYSMYVLYDIAQEWGIAKDFGVTLDLYDFSGTATGAQACVRGDVDITSSCVNEHIACLETTEDLVNFSFLGDFQGFFFVGREGEFTSWDDCVEAHGGDKAAAKVDRLNEFKGTSWCVIPQRKALIVDAISQVGLTAKDVTFIEFADDAKAAEAFIAGEGDFYTGGDQQQLALMGMGGYVNAGGSDILGPCGIWYDTFMTTREYMENNWDLCKQIYAMQLATVYAFQNNVDAAAVIASDYLTKATGSEYPISDWIEAQTIYDIYISLDDATNKCFNPEDTSHYWKGQADYNVQLLMDEGSLSTKIDTTDYFGDSERLFKEVIADEELVAKINSYKDFVAK